VPEGDVYPAPDEVMHMATKDKLYALRLPELQARFKEVVGEATKSPNRKFLIRRIDEALAKKADAKPRGRFKELSVEELRAKYVEVVGRPSGSSSKPLHRPRQVADAFDELVATVRRVAGLAIPLAHEPGGVDVRSAAEEGEEELQLSVGRQRALNASWRRRGKVREVRAEFDETCFVLRELRGGARDRFLRLGDCREKRLALVLVRARHLFLNVPQGQRQP